MTAGWFAAQVRAAQLREDRARLIHPLLYDYACRVTDRWQGLLNTSKQAVETERCDH